METPSGSPQNQNVVKGKIVFVGDASVGKTRIINAYNQVNDEIKSTVGAISITCTVQCGDRDITLNVWDTAGQENFQCLVPMFARCSQVAVIVFDLTQASSFESVQLWYNQMKENSQVPQIILCGNKSDLPQVVTNEQISEVRERLNLPFYRTSALTGGNIDILFAAIAEFVDQSDTRENTVVIPQVDFISPIDQTNHREGCC